MITFRLADSLPAQVTAQLEHNVRSDKNAAVERRRRLQELLDAGHGACYMGDPKIGRLMEDTLLHADGVQYRLLAWTVMPNHVHVLIETASGYPLSDVVQAWKSVTAHRGNQRLRRMGAFWYPDYFDRAIRDERHLNAAIHYIDENPVKAGLVGKAEDWPLGSARLSRVRPGTGEGARDPRH